MSGAGGEQGRVPAAWVSAQSAPVASAQVVLVGQEPVLFSGSVRDNITYGLEGCSDEKVLAAARAARAEEFIRELALGLDTGTAATAPPPAPASCALRPPDPSGACSQRSGRRGGPPAAPVHAHSSSGAVPVEAPAAPVKRALSGQSLRRGRFLGLRRGGGERQPAGGGAEATSGHRPGPRAGPPRAHPG